jgi:hypothetical protein
VSSRFLFLGGRGGTVQSGESGILLGMLGRIWQGKRDQRAVWEK